MIFPAWDARATIVECCLGRSLQDVVRRPSVNGGWVGICRTNHTGRWRGLQTTTIHPAQIQPSQNSEYTYPIARLAPATAMGSRQWGETQRFTPGL